MSWFGILAPEIRSTPSSSSSRGRINQFPFAVLKLPTRTFCTAARSCSHTALEGRAIPNSFSNDSLYLLSNIIAKYLKGHSFLRQQNTHVKQLWRFEARCSKESSRPRKLCCIRCMEDLISTTRYITWSLHNKNRGGLRQFLDSFGGTEQSNTGGNPLFAGLSPDSSLGSVAYEKQDSKPRADVKLSHLALGTDSSSSIQTSETSWLIF
ncbi:dynamin-like protein ARC5 isoform X1 [Quercus lobata]|uniref:dynamin-like protein ARC5 isoform X1 n=1 Tax=Quercus lobata TaxID=97700 RepID=UPI001244A931|nr:dynamin-like protein ARC5 isoform X1 [Quercus lobata]